LVEPVETADHVHAGLVVLCRERAISMAGSYVYVSEVTTVEASRCTRKKEEKIQAQGRQRQQWTLAGVACSSLPCDSHLIASPNFLHPPFPTCRSRLRWSPYIASMEGGGHVIFYSMSGPWLELPLSHVAEWSSYHSVRPQRVRRRRGEEAIE
jgi:hypothetical protein